MVPERLDLIALHFLPGDSPELNPAKCLNHDVKTNAPATPARDVTQLKDNVRAFLRSAQKRPAKVAVYFRERRVHYAAATT